MPNRLSDRFTASACCACCAVVPLETQSQPMSAAPITATMISKTVAMPEPQHAGFLFVQIDFAHVRSAS